MNEIVSHIEDRQCDGQSCDLKYYHSAKATLRSDNSIEGLFVHDKYPVRAAALLSRTRGSQRVEDTGDSSEHSGEECVIDSGDRVSTKCDEKLKSFASELTKDLTDQVVDDWERQLIGRTKTICGIPEMLKEMKQLKMSPDIYAENSFDRFKEAVDFLQVESLDFIEESVLKRQYKQFIKIISSMHDSASSEECVIETKRVIARLFCSREKLYEDIQIILYVISVAATKSTTESVIEAYVSQYEYGSNSRKNFSEVGISDTFEIQKDGPLVSRSDQLVRTALDKYFREKKTKGWHFFMKDSEKLFRTSKTMSKIDEKQSDLPFME